jgi:F-type H+-transporting ATPase subunit b
VIFWFARRPVSDALKNRSASVRRDIESAQEERAAARADLEDLEEKLADFELQVERLRKEMAEQAQHEREAILARAEREAQLVQASAERAIRDETQRARRQLQTDAVTLAVKLAEDILAARVADEDQQALARQLLDTVERDHSSIQES